VSLSASDKLSAKGIPSDMALQMTPAEGEKVIRSKSSGSTSGPFLAAPFFSKPAPKKTQFVENVTELKCRT
jgi:hypothetical protein